MSAVTACTLRAPPRFLAPGLEYNGVLQTPPQPRSPLLELGAAADLGIWLANASFLCNGWRHSEPKPAGARTDRFIGRQVAARPRRVCSSGSRLLFLIFSSVWLGPVPLFVSRSPTSRSPTSRPLLRSGRGLGLCRLLPGAGLAALF